MSEAHKYLIERRHPKLAEKQTIYQLCRDAYIGGTAFSADKYLIRNTNEYEKNFKQRKKLATYSNIVEPLIDIMTGLLFGDDIDRSKIPDKLNYINSNISNGIGIGQYMQNLVKQMSLYPFVVLVDSPADADQQITKDERKKNPYVVLYKFNEILDFSIGSDGKFDWLLLDVSSIDKSDPFKKPIDKNKYRLWQRGIYQDFSKVNDKIETDGPIEYDLDEIPAVMSGFVNIDDDVIESNVIENIVQLAKKKFNLDSLIDEILFSGAFKLLAWPVSNSVSVPENVKTDGPGEVAIIEYDSVSSSPPQFIGCEVEDINPYVAKGKELVSDVYNQLGFNSPDDDKASWNRSGVAISKDFAKTEALLKLWAKDAQRIENEIIRFCSLWEVNSDTISENLVIYPSDFEKGDIEHLLDQYFQILAMPYERLQKFVAKKIVKTVFAKEDKKEIKEIIDEIDQQQAGKDFDLPGVVKDDKTEEQNS